LFTLAEPRRRRALRASEPRNWGARVELRRRLPSCLAPQCLSRRPSSSSLLAVPTIAWRLRSDVATSKHAVKLLPVPPADCDPLGQSPGTPASGCWNRRGHGPSDRLRRGTSRGALSAQRAAVVTSPVAPVLAAPSALRSTRSRAGLSAQRW